MIDLEHLGRLLLIIIAAAGSISFLAWLIKRFLGVDTTARQTGILIGGIAGLLAGFRLAYDSNVPHWLAESLSSDFLVQNSLTISGYNRNKQDTIDSMLGRRQRVQRHMPNPPLEPMVRFGKEMILFWSSGSAA
jgi:hypothetical protein